MSRRNVYRESVLGIGYDLVKACVLQTAFELWIFEALKDAPKSALVLSEHLGANRRSLELFLNALVSLGFLASEGPMYQNTKYGTEIFLKGKPLYIGDMVGLQTRSAGNWLKLKECVMSGTSVAQPDFSKVDHVEAASGFARAMHNTAMGHAEFLSRKLPLAGVRSLLDLGGGPGTFTIHFLHANPGLRATIFDLPATLQTTRTFVEQAKLAERVSYQEGDFNCDEIKGMFGACFMSHIIHSQSAELNRALLSNVFKHLNPDGRLIVQDFFLNPDRTSPQFPALFALNMLVHTESGQTYTFDEVAQWMREAGFEEVKSLKFRLPRGIALLTAKKS